MGGRSSKDTIGVWANGKEIPRDGSAAEAIRRGLDSLPPKYTLVAQNQLPAGHKYRFRITDPNFAPVGVYSSEMTHFEKWIANNQDAVIKVARKVAGVTAATADNFIQRILPVLHSAGEQAARRAIAKEFSGNDAKLANELLTHLMASLPEITPVMDPGIVGGGSGAAVSQRLHGGIGDFAYRGAMEKFGALDADYIGGCGCSGKPNRSGGNVVIGADELDISTVTEYSNSVNSITKSKIIDELLEAAAKIGIKISGDTQQERIKSLLNEVPHGGKKIVSNAETHTKICRSLANAINRIHGTDVINKDLPADVICQQIAEIIGSLAAGVHTEFLAVYNDVRKVLRNLSVLKNALNDDHNAIMDRIKEAELNDPTAAAQLTTLSDLHKIITDEIERQIGLLSNLLNITLVPTEKDLASLIKSKKDIDGYIDKVDVQVGSERFGKVIFDILRGMGITASFTLLIEKALKTVGLTLDEYAKSSSLQKLREKITQNLMDKKFDDKQLHEYLEAAELLYKNFYRNQDIAKFIESQKSGRGEEWNTSMEDEFTGGADEYRKTVMDRRIADRKRLRNLIFHAFYKQLTNIFDQFIAALDILTLKVGTEIPLSDQLEGLRQAMQRINDSLVRSKDIYYALIGYYNDAMSRSKKDQLLADLKMVEDYLNTLLELPQYESSRSYFEAIKKPIAAMRELIDKFSDEIAAKFGGEEVSGGAGAGDADGNATYEGDNECQYLDKPDAVPAQAPTGGDDPLDVLPSLRYRSTKSIHDAIRQFDYKYRVAQIRQNMSATSKELEHYAESYEKIVANGVADYLKRQKETYDKLRKQLDEPTFNISQHVAQIIPEFASEDEVKKQREAAIKFLDAQWDAKQRFWATIEAVDAYMRVFTDALVKHPNDIREIKSMLEDIEVIREWYTERTGDMVTSVFDFFPSYVQNHGVNTTGQYSQRDLIYPPAEYVEPGDDHYYKKIGDKYNTPTGAGDLTNDLDVHRYTAPGHPHIVTTPVRAMQARETIKRVFRDGFSVLKNLLSVFVHIGSRFGGEEIRKKVFMSPNQMYNNIVEYLQASAFSQGIGIGPDAAAAALFEHWNDSENLGLLFDSSTGNVTQRLGANNNMLPTNSIPNYPEEFAGVATAALGQAPQPNRAAIDAVLLFKKRWGVWMRSVADGLKQVEPAMFNFKTEDQYFVMMMKALGAKILTVTGMYDVFDRPAEFNGLTPIRMIIGGAADTPKVEEGAVALYLRLPLLAQFYRNIFGFDDDEGYQPYSDLARKDRNVKISMVPDIDGTFAGLIRLIFRKTKHIENRAYSDDDVKEIVREVNLIYQRMQAKYPQNTVMETIHEFIAEVNRRYGIISKTERADYEREFGYRYDYSITGVPDRYAGPSEANEIAILPGEGDEEVTRPSPAQKLLGSTLSAGLDKKSPFNITTQHRDLVYRFRCMIDKYFENPDERYTFNSAIKAAQLKLKKETNDENRFKIVANLIRGVDIFSKIDGMKYLLFHETVVAGLNILSAIHSMLARFKLRAHLLDIDGIFKFILKWWGAQRPSGNGVDVDIDDIVNAVTDHICNELRLIPRNQHVSNYIRNLFGFREAKISNGGHASEADNDYIIKGSSDCLAFDNRGGVRRIQRGSTLKIVLDNNNIVRFQSQPGGLLDLLHNREVATVAAYKPDTRDKELKQVMETIMRYLFGREFVMKELLESIFGLSHDFQGLVTVTVEDGKLYLSYSGLKSLIEDMFQQISYFMDILRPHISVELLERYTDKLRPGSFYWLQEQLLEKIIVGRPEQPVEVDGVRRPGYASLDQLMQKITTTFNILTKEYDVDGNGLAPGGGARSRVNEANHSKNHFGWLFAELVFYNGNKPQSGLIRTPDANVTNNAFESLLGLGLADYNSDPYDALLFAGAAGERLMDTRYIQRFKQLYSWKEEFNMNRSALFTFNQLVAKYIQAFYDPVAAKMYNGAINSFVSGAFNRAVADQLATYPDVVPLVIVKNVASGITRASPTDSTLAVHLSINDMNAANALTELIEQLLEYGIKKDGRTDVAHRKILLSPSNIDTFGTVSTLLNINNVATPKLLIYLLAHWIARAVYDALKFTASLADNTAPGSQNYPTDLDALFAAVLNRQPAFTNIGQVRSTLAVDPNNPDMQKILNIVLDNSSIQNLNRVVTLVYNQNNNQLYDIDQNSVLYKAVSAMNGTLSARLLDVWNYIKVPADHLSLNLSNNLGGILTLAASYFTLGSDSIGRNLEELKQHAKLYAYITINLKLLHDASGADQKAFKKALAQFRSNIEPMAAYKPPTTTQPRYIVKQEEILLANTEELDSNTYGTSLSDVTYLRYPLDPNSPGQISHAELGPIGDGPINARSNSITVLRNFERRIDPDANHILYTSLSIILRNITSTRLTRTPGMSYLIENAADVPLYMKEKIRANMPMFRNLFKELIARCEFIKKIISQRDVDLTRDTNVAADAGSAVNPWHNPWPYVLKPVTTNSTDTKDRFVGILDSIIRGCMSLVSCCEQTLRDIGDEPRYFETYFGSIKDYKSQYGIDPLMPLSSTLAVLKNVKLANQVEFFPIHSMGKDEFKFLYGVRSLLGQPTAQPLLEYATGFTQIVDNYNMMTDGKFNVDKSRAEAFFKTFVKLLRYVFELKHIKGILTPHILIQSDRFKHPNEYDQQHQIWPTLLVDGMFARDDLVVTNLRRGQSTTRTLTSARVDESGYGAGRVKFKNTGVFSLIVGDIYTDTKRPPKPVYSIAKDLADVIRLTESSFKDDKIKELVEYIAEETRPRNSIEIQNIIDLNIVPINVHALMREIPLVNLYNYSYTFDRLIIELYYGLRNENARKLISELCGHQDRLSRITSSKDMLVALLIDPYMPVTDEDTDAGKTYEYIKGMLTGANPAGGDLGRPKFLSDQIYNKAIFGELYPNTESYNEQGPSAAFSIDRARLRQVGISLMYIILIQMIEGIGKSLSGQQQSLFDALPMPEIIKYTVEYITAHPRQHAKEVRRAISNFITTHPQTQQVLQQQAQVITTNKTDTLSVLVAILGKILNYAISKYINKLSVEGYSDQLATKAAKFITMHNAIITLIQTANVNWIGTNATDIQGVLAQARTLFSTQQNALQHQTLTGVISNANLANIMFDPNDYEDIFRLIPELFWDVKITYALGGYRIPRDEVIKRFVVRLTSAAQTNISMAPNSLQKRLTWLTYVTNKKSIEEPGVGIEDEPHGDNENVLDIDQIQSADVADIAAILARVGRMRFNTIWIRNLIFIVNLYRSIRVKLQRDLVYNKDIIAKSIPITRPQLTEFFGNQTYLPPLDYSRSQMWQRYNI